MNSHGFNQREPSISSERTLDNLDAIPSNQTSPLHSPPYQRSLDMDRNPGPDFRPGSSRPPHHHRGRSHSPIPLDSYQEDRGEERTLQTRVSWQQPNVAEVHVSPQNLEKQTSQFSFDYSDAQNSPHHSPIRSSHMPTVATGSDTSPVRRLKKKDSEAVPRVERELSDAYIDSISRTPRYTLGRHNTYDDMLTSMENQDPFKGDYQPSGKSPRMERSKIPTGKKPAGQSRKKENFMEDQTEDYSQSKSKKKKKRKKHEKHNMEMIDGSTLESQAHSNRGYTGREADRDSLRSNGTYTLNEKQKDDIRSSITNMAAPVLKKTPAKVKSINQQTCYSKQEEVDNQAFAKFIKSSNILMRECKVYIQAKKNSYDCQCGRNVAWHEENKIPIPDLNAEYIENKGIWHHKTHTEATTTDSFGVIQFQGFGQEFVSSPYVRLCPRTDMETLWDLLTVHWKLPIPKLLISVTGGAQRFNLNPRLKAVFKRGLINAATTTGAWIITGGTATGVMQFVGEAVRDHLITLASNETKVVALGIATWGCIANREALDGADDLNGLFPANYCLEDVSEIKGRDVPLDHNHTHFMLVDDGTEGKFGGEIEFRTMFERYVSEKVETGVAESQSVNVPVVMLVVEGGVNTMKTVWQATEQNIPVLVLNGSGRAADFIAIGYSLSKDPRDEDKSTFGKEFDEDMKHYARFKFNWKKTDNIEKKVHECLRQLKDALRKRRLVNVFNLGEAESKDIDRAILYALLKANKTNATAQLSLALAWNRCDIARHEIFTQDNRKYWKNLKLYDAMFTALVQDRVDFVQLFMENGVSMKKFLSIETLWNLYANSLADSSDTIAQLISNLMLYLKQTWTAYLCCRPTESHANDPDLLTTIGKVLVHLLGDENMNPYNAETFQVTFRRPSLKWLPGNHESKLRMSKKEGHFSTYTSDGRASIIPGSADAPNDPLHDTVNLESLKPDSARKFFKRKRQTYDFKLAERELFFFAILLNRREMGKMMWKAGHDQLGAALIACSILQALAKIADDDEELELSQDLLDHANMYEDMAVGVLSECYKKDKNMAHQLLVRRLEQYGRTTLFALADTNSLMKFMGHTSCQTKLNLIWRGRMALYTQSWKICLSLIFPFFIPTIKFTTNQGMLPDGEDDGYDDIDEGEECCDDEKCEEVKVISNKHSGKRSGSGKLCSSGKVMPDAKDKNDTEDELFVRAKSRRQKQKRKKLYRVQMFSDIRTNSIGIFSAFYFFYTAPVSVFIVNTVSYLVFLSLFSFFVLTDLYPHKQSVIEYVIWGWTITMFAEEIRQVASNDKRSILYKIQDWFGSMWNRFDLGMYMIFLTSVILRFTLTGDNFVYARVTYSITVAMYCLRFMQVFFVEKNIGPKVIMIKNMLVDLAFFLFIFLVFLLSFGVMYQANLFPNSPPSWRLLKDVLYIPYWQMYGELFIENMEGQHPDGCTTDENIWRAAGGQDRCPEQNALVPLLAAVYMILTNILLVNLLIAMFSYTFQMVQDKSEQVWRFYRYSLVYEYYDRPVFCPPLIIISHIYLTARWILRKTCSPHKYHNEFKLNLDEADNNRLTLFVRSATEQYLNVSLKAEKEELGNKVADTATRLDRVIEELDSIKEHVVQSRRSPIVDENLDIDTPVLDATDAAQLSARRPPSRGGMSMDLVEQRMNDLSDQVTQTNNQMAQMMHMMQSVMQPRHRTSHLEINDTTQ